MNIKFTRHAKFRCVQRKIPEPWVVARLQKIPLSPGTHEHLLDGTNLTIVYHDGDINRTVITLYSLVSEEPRREKKKHVDLAPFKDMLKKENQKYIRRKKQLTKNKFKKK